MYDETQARLAEEAFARGVEMLGTDEMFLKLSVNAVKMVGHDLVTALAPAERPMIGAPAQVVHDGGRIDMGALLITERRALVAWSQGVLRPVTTVRAFERSEIGEVTGFRRKGAGRLAPVCDAISFATPVGSAELVLYAAADTESRQQFLLAGFLNGSVDLTWRDADADQESEELADVDDPSDPAQVADARAGSTTGAIDTEATMPSPGEASAASAEAAPAPRPTVQHPAAGGALPGVGAAQVRLGASEFTWPFPDREVEVGGRRLSVEVLAVAALYGIAGLWLFWKVRDIFGVASLLPSLFSSNAFEFVFAWVIFMAAAMIFYVVVGLLYTCYLLLRADPVGRGLATVLFGAATLLLFTSMSSGPVVFAFLVTGACSAVLHLSPWARRTFATAPMRHGRPAPVVLAQTLAVSYFSLLAIAIVMVLPGLRFVGEAGLGARFVVLVLFCSAACVIALVGASHLRQGASRQARLLLTSGVVLVLIGQLVVWVGASFVVALVIGATVVGLLWLEPAAREWFGDVPAGEEASP